MAKPAKVWVITDTHFNDDNMDKVRPKGYEQLIVKNCRRLIAPQDILIHLGDVIFARAGELKYYLGKIPGAAKILVRGNHDRQADNWYINQGFAFVCDGLSIGLIYLSHQPLPSLPAGCMINVHGHFHNFELREDEHLFYSDSVHKLLALEHTGYAPVLLNSFLG